MTATVEDGVVVVVQEYGGLFWEVVVCVPLTDGAADVGASVSGPVGRCVVTVAVGSAVVEVVVSPIAVVVTMTKVVEPCASSVTVAVEGKSEVVVSCPAVAVAVVLSVDAVTISGAFVVGVTGSTGGGDCHARISPA